MEAILRIEEVAERGRKFHFRKSDNLIIGRLDPMSKALVNLVPEDPFISQHHFMIEVRPPNCQVRDNGSINSVFIQRKRLRRWRRIDEYALEGGHQIRIERTCYGFNSSNRTDPYDGYAGNLEVKDGNFPRS
jgi:eukaryotic-like serine/threonine-protein kinase